MQRWQAYRHQLDVLDLQLVAISPDTVAEAARMREKTGLTLPLLSDATVAVARRYNLTHRTPAAARGPVRELPIPATFLLDADGIVRWINLAEDFRVLSHPDQVLPAVRAALGGGAALPAT